LPREGKLITLLLGRSKCFRERASYGLWVSGYGSGL
jgi:hypothetical protein